MCSGSGSATGGKWLDQLATLTLPVLTIVPAPARFVGQTIGRLAEDTQTVVAQRGIVPPGTAVARGQAATAELLLDRLGSHNILHPGICRLNWSSVSAPAAARADWLARCVRTVGERST